MTLLRVLALAFLVCGPASGALAASDVSQAASPTIPLGLKVCLVGAALGAAVERLRSGPNTRRP